PPLRERNRVRVATGERTRAGRDEDRRGRDTEPGSAAGQRREGSGSRTERRGAASRNADPGGRVPRERGAAGRERARRARVDTTADRAMGTPEFDKAARRAKVRAEKRKQSGPPLLDPATRSRLEELSREGAGLRAAWATFRVRTDDIRRRNYEARAEQEFQDGFDR